MTVLDRLRDSCSRVLPSEPVNFMYLFGSHARGNADAVSDVDVAAYFDDSVAEGNRLEVALRIARGLESDSGVGPIESVLVLNDASLPVAGRVVNEGRLLYSRAEPERVAYESLTFRMFTDFDYMFRPLDTEALRAHARGER